MEKLLLVSAGEQSAGGRFVRAVEAPLEFDMGGASGKALVALVFESASSISSGERADAGGPPERSNATRFADIFLFGFSLVFRMRANF